MRSSSYLTVATAHHMQIFNERSLVCSCCRFFLNVSAGYLDLLNGIPSPENPVHAQSDKTYDNVGLLHMHPVATADALFGNIKGPNSS